jgi:hypothetical protein
MFRRWYAASRARRGSAACQPQARVRLWEPGTRGVAAVVGAVAAVVAVGAVGAVAVAVVAVVVAVVAVVAVAAVVAVVAHPSQPVARKSVSGLRFCTRSTRLLIKARWLPTPLASAVNCGHGDSTPSRFGRAGR